MSTGFQHWGIRKVYFHQSGETYIFEYNRRSLDISIIYLIAGACFFFFLSKRKALLLHVVYMWRREVLPSLESHNVIHCTLITVCMLKRSIEGERGYIFIKSSSVTILILCIWQN